MLTVNGTQVQKLQVRGPVGYTKVGSPTISNGVVSGFSTSNYITLSQNATYIATDEFEWNIKFTTGSILQTSWLLALDAGSMRGIYYTSGSVIYIQLTSSVYGEIVGYTMQPNTTYTINAVKRNDGTLVSTLKDVSGNTLAQQTKTVGDIAFTAIVSKLGQAFSSYFNGSIDLNETYIKVNDKLWFYQPSTNYLVKDGKLVFADSGLYLSGPVNYELVGSPTIVDNVASGFSSSNYLRLSDYFYISPDSSFDMVFKVNLDAINVTQTVFGFGPSFGTFNAGVGIANNNDIMMPGTSAVCRNQITQTGTYYIRVIKENNSMKIGCSTDKITWNYGSSVAISDYIGNTRFFPMLGRENTAAANPLQGSIDLNETYIKVDGSLWFYGKNYASQNIAPVPSGYTYGTTTTSAIGYVDMRTQQFTAAPAGATIGKDE